MTDAPSALLINEILAAYLTAKVVLVERNSDEGIASMEPLLHHLFVEHRRTWMESWQDLQGTSAAASTGTYFRRSSMRHQYLTLSATRLTGIILTASM